MYLLLVSACSVTKLCKLRLTLCDPVDWSWPGSSVLGISQARIMEWAAISPCRGSFRPRDRTHVSCIGKQILYHWATWEVLEAGSNEASAQKCQLRRPPPSPLPKLPHRCPLSPYPCWINWMWILWAEDSTSSQECCIIVPTRLLHLHNKNRHLIYGRSKVGRLIAESSINSLGAVFWGDRGILGWPRPRGSSRGDPQGSGYLPWSPGSI